MNGTPHQVKGVRALGSHAGVVGIGWFVVAFGGMVGVGASAGATSWLSTLSHMWQGALLVTLLTCAVPVVWPVYLALGWYEASLATRWRQGDAAARGLAVRVLLGQAVVFGVLALPMGAAAVMDGGGRDSYFTLAWVPLASIAAWHGVTVRRVYRS